MRHRDVGLWHYDRAKATPGFTIISPLQDKNIYLLGMNGDIRHSWPTVAMGACVSVGTYWSACPGSLPSIRDALEYESS